MASNEGVIIGSGDHRYRFVRDWARLPRGWLFRDANAKAQPPRIVSKGAVAANGEVFVLARSAHPVTVFDPDGNFITSWGEGQFSSFVHGLTIAPSGNIWIVNSGWHVVTEHAPTGELLRTIGDREFPAPPSTASLSICPPPSPSPRLAISTSATATATVACIVSLPMAR